MIQLKLFVVIQTPKSAAEHIKAVECLWEVFGGTTTDQGYKVLNERVGLIYGDSITLDRAQRILEGLEAKGFLPTTVVLGSAALPITT